MSKRKFYFDPKTTNIYVVRIRVPNRYQPLELVVTQRGDESKELSVDDIRRGVEMFYETLIQRERATQYKHRLKGEYCDTLAQINCGAYKVKCVYAPCRQNGVKG